MLKCIEDRAMERIVISNIGDNAIEGTTECGRLSWKIFHANRGRSNGSSKAPPASVRNTVTSWFRATEFRHDQAAEGSYGRSGVPWPHQARRIFIPRASSTSWAM
jgi:hypothetical protein